MHKMARQNIPIDYYIFSSKVVQKNVKFADFLKIIYEKLDIQTLLVIIVYKMYVVIESVIN